MAPAFQHTHRFLLALLAALTLSVGLVAPAQAHDELIKAVPEENAELASAPEEVSLTFSGNLTTGQGIPNVILVRDDQDANWADGEAEVDGRTITVGLKDGLRDGTYRVSYRVVYSDGHPEEKMYSFTVGEPATAEQTDTATDEASAAEGTTSPAAEAETTAAADDGERGGSGFTTGIWVALGLAIAVALGFFDRKRRQKRSAPIE